MPEDGATRKRFIDREGVVCFLPTRLPAEEAEIYQALRRTHCADGRDGHDCQGRVSLDRNGITLNCPRCGDARALYPTAATAVAPPEPANG